MNKHTKTFLVADEPTNAYVVFQCLRFQLIKMMKAVF